MREQLAIAALDIGRLKLAKVGISPLTMLTPQEQIAALDSKFPNSPRLEIIHGMWLEATGEVQKAKELYQRLLKADGCNVVSYPPVQEL